MNTVTIHLKPSLRFKRVQVVNDALPGLILLFSGLETLSNKGFTHDVMPYISVVVGLFVLRWAIEELRKEEKHRKIKWFDIAGGCVIFLDAANRYNVHKGFQPAHLLILAGIIIVFRGIFGEKLPSRRRVVLKDDGVFARTALFRSLSCAWSDIERIERGTSAVVFILKKGRKRLNLKRAANRSEVIDKICEAAATREIPVRESA